LGRLLVARNERNRKVALYSIHANPSNANEFVTGGRDQYVRVYDRRWVGGGHEGTVTRVRVGYCRRRRHAHRLLAEQSTDEDVLPARARASINRNQSIERRWPTATSIRT